MGKRETDFLFGFSGRRLVFSSRYRAICRLANFLTRDNTGYESTSSDADWFAIAKTKSASATVVPGYPMSTFAWSSLQLPPVIDEAYGHLAGMLNLLLWLPVGVAEEFCQHVIRISQPLL